jgi:hypothetical protein
MILHALARLELAKVFTDVTGAWHLRLYGDVSEKPMMGMFNPFSVGTLTPLER